MKPINTKKLVSAFKSTSEKPIHYQPYGGGAGYICNGYMGAVITDHDSWRDLLLKLGSEAEKGRVKMFVQENLDEQMHKAMESATRKALTMGITVTRNSRTVDLFEVERKIVALDCKYLAPVEDWIRASGSDPLSPIVIEGFGYEAVICPVHPKTIATQLHRAADLLMV